MHSDCLAKNSKKYNDVYIANLLNFWNFIKARKLVMYINLWFCLIYFIFNVYVPIDLCEYRVIIYKGLQNKGYIIVLQ